MGTEQDNKIRLSQARRQETQSLTLDKADNMPARRGEKGSVEREKINQLRLNKQRKAYGEKKEGAEAKKRTSGFKGIKRPMAAIKKAKDIATAPTKIKIATDIPIYGTAMALAGLKDLLDLSFISSLPGIGFVITACFSIAIAFVLMLDGVSSMKKKVARRMTRRFLVLCAGTLVEGLFFGLNFLPFEMITVAIIYWMSLVDRKNK